MKTLTSKFRIVFVATFPPTQCGIATYTNDLITSVHRSFGENVECVVCNITDQQKTTPEAPYVLNPEIREDYSRVALEINEDPFVELVHIQHEFGLFRGNYGNYLLDFLEVLQKPVAFTFHSVIPHPGPELKQLVKTLGRRASVIFVMTGQSARILEEDYGIAGTTIQYVPHGTHIVEYALPEEIRKKHRLENRIILSTFGLLGPGKSIETALRALPGIVKYHPSVLYLIIGKTHPNNIKNHTDGYRDYLENMVEDLKLYRHVLFIDCYLAIGELLEYLKATDIYLFTSRDPNQAVSGTFSYAMSCACPIVATSIPHTREVLTPDAGILINIENSEQLSEAVNLLLADHPKRVSMGISGFLKTRESSWENVAVKHVNTYNRYIHNHGKISFDYPEVKLDHLKKMTTSTGIIQFSKMNKPDLSSGYTLDDNARALIAFCSHFRLYGNKDNLRYIRTYLDFVERCQQPCGTFVNYIDENNREHIKNSYVNLEDSNARAVWALGCVISHKEYLPEAIVNKASTCLIKCTRWIKNIMAPRAIGFTIKGLFLYHSASGDDGVVPVIEKLAKNLVSGYDLVAVKDWKWFEEYMTYANSILPEAMLYTYLVTGDFAYKRTAVETLDFLLSKMFANGEFKVISNKGWLVKDAVPHPYGEQPIDVSCTIQTLDIFYRTFGIARYEDMMSRAFDWFLGKNHLSQTMYNPATGGCYDGLEKDGVNVNQGAESTICYLMARLTMENNRRVKEPKLIPVTTKTGTLKRVPLIADRRRDLIARDK
ncbi:glycosyltransferase [Sinomicrobium pectinilyticum]|uniref:Glycosyltransferase n=1 Tax=Sinomicrobium pectinilyticum TaxID=1084421 RepID=A0A3N0DIQ9_SINP1|nr:glycosyltransferase [Sinomicrobium pectinilyticum]RNL75281.1 glycosyltransferase [Sinomicrobium pectinilyticum]